MQAVEIYFQPPLAIARVGPSPQPMPNFRWATDRSLHGAHQTTIKPDVTLRVTDVGRTSVTYDIEIARGGVTCVQGKLVAVFLDRVGGTPQPWPDEYRKAFESAGPQPPELLVTGD